MTTLDEQPALQCQIQKEEPGKEAEEAGENHEVVLSEEPGVCQGGGESELARASGVGWAQLQGPCW